MLPQVVTVQNMRESDAHTIASGTTSAELMHRAALGIFQSVRFVGKVAIVCGVGNNGGDGYALACILLENGLTPTIFRVDERFSRDGLFYYHTAMSKGAEEGNISVPAPFTGCDIIVDCLLGTGFKGEVSGAMQRAIFRSAPTKSGCSSATRPTSSTSSATPTSGSRSSVRSTTLWTTSSSICSRATIRL